MKTVTSLVDLPLPLPDGRSLPPRGSLVIADSVAGSDRIQGWAGSQAVSLADYDEHAAPAEPLPESAATRVAPEPKAVELPQTKKTPAKADEAKADA